MVLQEAGHPIPNSHCDIWDTILVSCNFYFYVLEISMGLVKFGSS